MAAKTSNKDRMVQNIDVFDFNLTKSEVKQILNLKNKPKKIDDEGAHTHPDYPFFESMNSLSESSNERRVSRNNDFGLRGSMNLDSFDEFSQFNRSFFI